MKTIRFALFAGVLLGLGMAFSQCGSTNNTGKCDATSCPNGCCNASGQCTAGTTLNACGKGGVACEQCGAGKACVAQVCGGSATGGGAGGGGGTGGGGGSTGDGGITCGKVLTYGTLTNAQVTSVRLHPYSDGTVENRIRFDLDADAGIYVYQHLFFDPAFDTPPLNYDLGKLADGGALTWLESYGTGTAMGLGLCGADGTCEQLFLSQGGTSTWTAVGGDPMGGRMAGSASNIRLVEWAWDYNSTTQEVVSDEPVLNPTCIDIAGWSFDLEYTASEDGGYVVPFDAGM